MTADQGEGIDLLTDEENTELEPPNQPATTTSTTTVSNVAPPPSTGTVPTVAPTVHTPQQGGQQKESVFVRLANRIKVRF